jgi:hypothetical protein
MSDDLVKRRVELKHVFPAGEGEALRARMRALRPDARRLGGWVTTVYFDLPDRRFTRAALESPDANLKIRLREYFSDDDLPCSPFVWLEIKERDGSRSSKSRFQLHKRMVGGFLDGDLDLAAVLTCQEGSPDLSRVVDAARRLHDLARGGLVPVGAVRYLRASVQEPAARLTLDRHVAYHVGPLALYEAHDGLDARALGAATFVDGAAVVEVKHAGEAPPAWCRGFVGDRPASDYSKFIHLARLSLTEPSYVD